MVQTSTKTDPERNYGETRLRDYKSFNQPLAVACGQWLQGASGKLQASSHKLDKKE